MIANPARRAFALLWALAFVLGTAGEGFGLHPCPHHDGGASHSAAAAAGDAHDGHHAAAPDSDDPAAAASHAGAGQAPGESHDGPCTCGSACQAATGAALPGARQAEPAATIVFDPDAPRSAEATVAIVRPPHFLPFAHAPPRLG